MTMEGNMKHHWFDLETVIAVAAGFTVLYMMSKFKSVTTRSCRRFWTWAKAARLFGKIGGAELV
jgi:hypothetical protein